MKPCTKHKLSSAVVDENDTRAGLKYVCQRKDCDYVTYTSCTIMRTFERTSGIKFGIKFGMYGGGFDYSEAVINMVTEVCGIPLFGRDGHDRGVCPSCAKGWEVEGKNMFASDAERERAKGGQ